MQGCTSGQLALAWVLAQGNDFIPIPGWHPFVALQLMTNSLDRDNLKHINLSHHILHKQSLYEAFPTQTFGVRGAAGSTIIAREAHTDQNFDKAEELTQGSMHRKHLQDSPRPAKADILTCISLSLKQRLQRLNAAGTKRIKNLEDNFGALKVKLSDAEVEELSSIIPADEVTQLSASNHLMTLHLTSTCMSIDRGMKPRERASIWTSWMRAEHIALLYVKHLNN